MKTKTDHIDTLAQVKQRKQELKAIIKAEKQEMSDIAKSIHESLKPHNIVSTFVNGFTTDDSHQAPIDDTVGAIIGMLTNKKGKLNKYLRVAVIIAPAVFKLLKMFKTNWKTQKNKS